MSDKPMSIEEMAGMLDGVANQRNMALNEAAMWSGKYKALEAENTALKAENEKVLSLVSELRETIADVAKNQKALDDLRNEAVVPELPKQ